MARQARKDLADMRAMEEQNARVTMRGRGAIVGAGATPSMGLSQFRGGGDMYDSSSDEGECSCKKCKKMHGGVVRLVPNPRNPGAYILPDPGDLALIPRPPVRPPPRPPARPPPRPGTEIEIRPPSGRYPATPSMPPSYYDSFFPPTRGRPPLRIGDVPDAPNAPAPGRATTLTPSQRATMTRLLAAGLPLAAVAAFLGISLSALGANSGNNNGDSGYYDDYAGDSGDVFAPGGDIGYDPGTGAPGTGAPGTGAPGTGAPGAPTRPMPKLTKKEIKFYLQSGNLPDRFYSGLAQKRGSGKSDGRTARAAVVRKVMQEKGMKLIEASKYVKEHGLYKK
jgi:hypothetical protein